MEEKQTAEDVSSRQDIDFDLVGGDFNHKTQEAALFLKGLANPQRLSILCQLIEGEKHVGALVEKSGLSQPAISQHLARLRDENIVSYRRDHRTIYYFIQNQTVLKIMDVLSAEYCGSI